MDNDSPVIWITGASSGIGLALAKKYLALGFKVIASSRQTCPAKSLRDNANCSWITLDTTSETSLMEANKLIEQQFGYIDKLIVNAGTCEYPDALPYDLGMWDRIYQVNLLGSIATINIALPLLKHSPNRAHIIGIGSMVFFAPFAKAGFYGATKAGFDYFLKALRVDLHSHHIDVTIIHPGFVKTPLTDKNTFKMPFLVPVDKAADIMVSAIEKRKKDFYFPKKLGYILKLSRIFPSFWVKKMAEKLPFDKN